MSDIYLTIRFPFNVCCREARLLLSTARLFRLAILRFHDIVLQESPRISSEIYLKKAYRKRLWDLLPNRRYVDGVITLLYSVYESAQVLGVPLNEIEFRDWLLFQQSEREYPCKNIKMHGDFSFDVKVVDFQGSVDTVSLKPTVSKRYRELLSKVLELREPYVARVKLNRFGARKGDLWVHGEIQVSVRYRFYTEHFSRVNMNRGKLYAGVDVNVDRMNLAIVDSDGRLRDFYTFWFEEASRKGCSRRRARSIIGMRVHEMLKYAYHHGVRVIFLENPEVLGKLKLLWVRSGDRRHENYNYRVSVFRSSVIEMIALKAPLYGIEVRYVDPKGTTSSREHDEIAEKHRLDRHTASAYLIALKGLKQP
jgi:hypothetical protein